MQQQRLWAKPVFTLGRLVSGFILKTCGFGLALKINSLAHYAKGISKKVSISNKNFFCLISLAVLVRYWLENTNPENCKELLII